MPFSSGYVPAEDVMERRAGEDEEGFGFSDRLTAEQYAVFCQSYLANSSLRRSVDRFDPERDDFKTVELAPADYIRYMWVTISKVVAELGIDLTVGNGLELVVLEAEG